MWLVGGGKVCVLKCGCVSEGYEKEGLSRNEGRSLD
jgi:hypothetical protein